MFSHIMIGSNDIARSKTFYDAVLGTIGAKPGVQDAMGRLIYAHKGGRLMISKPIDGEPACCANGGTIGFEAASIEEAEAWHTAGIDNGGQSVEDPPGIRPGGKLYLGYMRDPDGNKLCVLYRLPTAA